MDLSTNKGIFIIVKQRVFFQHIDCQFGASQRTSERDLTPRGYIGISCGHAHGFYV